ncbi:Thioesterase/thiol ester dehydrase-isomerase [Myriangium duriaei CBS 260.36]|uniref:Thioesterase/thiol ester dehydrase-isomerase n=1 Tax=Myriangium duriaei CBS 260.36 TaxID=1168546 RepID=A0A9P4JB77_9PEZI|nr:Thioesterase/thiol ester dehydrase-isomerase [Myriangium duriaei CBS 260.36]
MNNPFALTAQRCRPLQVHSLRPIGRLSPLSTSCFGTLARPRHPDFPPFHIFLASQRRLVSSNSKSFPISTPSSPSPHTKPPHKDPPARISALRLILLSTLFLAAGFVMAAAPTIPTATGLITPPSDAETLNLFTPPTESASHIDSYILSHPLSKKYRADAGFTESRPHMRIPQSMRAHNLTGGTLLGEDKMEVPPLCFSSVKADLPSFISIVHVGPALCGHPGIVHGGLLATLLDEGLARACFPALPNKVGVTASLKIDYRKPCPANSYIVLRAETTMVEGRKAWVKGWIEILGEGTEEGSKVAEAEALFIEPKGAANMPKIHSSS